MELKAGCIVLMVSLLLVARGRGAEPSFDPTQLTQVERDQWEEFKKPGSYCHHVLAVDAEGNALLPRVSATRAADGSLHYRATTSRLAGEDTSGAKIDAAVVDALFNGQSSGAGDEAVRNVLHGRKLLYLYLDEMFKAIERERPDEIVVHVHGGLNQINGAIEKTALISDDLRASQQEHGRRIFYIGICWNSDLFLTYEEHLGSIREGLRQPGKALVTAPAMLLADLGGAACRLPLNLINFLYQDLYTVRPAGFKRTQLAQARIDQIRARGNEGNGVGAIIVSRADTQRAESARRADAAQWLLSQPTKIATTFFLDWLGSEPWKDMLRHTRTMFERESSFIPSIDYHTAESLAQKLSARTGRLANADTLLDQMNSTGRQGAVSLFCDQAQSRLLGAKKRPVITLIGHSMGCIVSSEILQRFHQLSLDNVVFMGAACSVTDFKVKVIPYLQEQNLRESLRTGGYGDLGARISHALQDVGASPEMIAAARQQCDAPTSGAPVTKTRFYNLCLHDTVENGEKNPAETDLIQRGSLLTWIDVLYQKPESENDRTFGRWVNAILASDSLPSDVVDRITIKEFGVDRPLAEHFKLAEYAFQPGDPKTKQIVQEPMHHGDFGRFEPGVKRETTNLAYWREIFRLSEDLSPAMPMAATQPKAVRASRQPGLVTRRNLLRIPKVLPPTQESAASRNARTGF